MSKVPQETPDVRVGDIWADNDKRSSGRQVEVRSVGETHVWVTSAGVGYARRQWRIRIDRMRPTSTGYRLVSRAGEPS